MDDFLIVIDTPAGKAEILYLKKREDFEHTLRALVYRCKLVMISASIGDSTIKGLVNWKKIHHHKEEYLTLGGVD